MVIANHGVDLRTKVWDAGFLLVLYSFIVNAF